MTLAEWQQKNPGIPVSGGGRYLLLVCGRGIRYEDLDEAKAAKVHSCGLTCAGIEFHRGYIFDAEWKPPRSWRRMVEQA